MVQGLATTNLKSNVQPPPPLGSLRTQRKAARCSKHSCKAHSLDSIDTGDEEDKRLTRELESQISKRIDPLKNAKLADHLNLLWSVSQVKTNFSAPRPLCSLTHQSLNSLHHF